MFNLRSEIIYGAAIKELSNTMTEAGDLSAQIREMKELLQLQLQQAQTNAAGATASSGPSTPVNAPAKMNQVKVPEGH